MSNPDHKKWRVSIRTAIGVLTVLAIVFALLGNYWRRLRIQEEAFNEIARRGGTILVYDEGTYVHFHLKRNGLCGTGLQRVISPQGAGLTFTDDDAHHLHAIIAPVSVDLTSTEVSKESLAELRRQFPDCQFYP